MTRTNRVLSAREIQRRYDGEWVFVAEPEMDEVQNLVRGKVLFHGADSSEIYRKAATLKERPSRFAMLWIGSRPRIPALVL